MVERFQSVSIYENPWFSLFGVSLRYSAVFCGSSALAGQTLTTPSLRHGPAVRFLRRLLGGLTSCLSCLADVSSALAPPRRQGSRSGGWPTRQLSTAACTPLERHAPPSSHPRTDSAASHAPMRC